jgi:hypothetical protein
VWSVIKFLVFYIALQVFVNMIFIHLYVFLPSSLSAVFLGRTSPFGNLSIYRVLTGTPDHDGREIGYQQCFNPEQPAILAFLNGHGYNLTL